MALSHHTSISEGQSILKNADTIQDDQATAEHVLEWHSQESISTVSEDSSILGTMAAAREAEITRPSFWKCLRLWWLETVAAVIVLSSTAAVSTLLFLYQSEPLEEWPYRISINAVVSALIVCLKAAVVSIAIGGKESRRSYSYSLLSTSSWSSEMDVLSPPQPTTFDRHIPKCKSEPPCCFEIVYQISAPVSLRGSISRPEGY